MRKGNRVLTAQQVEIDGKYTGQAVDLSVVGVYVSTQVSYPINTVVNLKFQLIHHPIEAQAKVIYIDEGIGMGVRFLTLKPEDAKRISAYVEAASPSHQIQPNVRRNQILIIDDTHFYREAYQQYFQSEGFSVLVAQNGIEGLRVLLKERPDAILLDLMMDGMDAFKVLHIIKSRSELKGIPVFILSDRGTQQEMNRAVELGAAELLIKSTSTPDKVGEKVRVALQQRSTLF